ncbi:hypothetical protein [Rhizobium hainanense]|uniref:TniQ protein n=1 Tax=Rhizobium hainanense TaxID=52131 RepID=A0A1C3WL73_9HYPH|nr:hypothetical protein [Rhizobium hainanense]SCB40678.1 hypothetical protein GA0061100_12620 [Rhizobium hainanense]
MACRYGCTPAEIELWLGYEDRPLASSGFELRDFRPDPTAVRSWARAARLKIADVEAMMLSRSVRTIDWYVADRRERGICPDCLDEDVSVGRDHYLRREWAHVEAAACGKHRRLLQDFCDRCFARGRFGFECIEESARLVCGGCSTVVSGVQNKIESAANLDFLLVLTTLLGAGVEGREDSIAPDEIRTAIETLWSPSQANGKPFIAWLSLKLPCGRVPVCAVRGNPLAGLLLPWRIATFVATAQLLDLVQARRWFGPPPPYLEDEFAIRKRSPLARPAGPPDSGGAPETTRKLSVRSDAEYRRLAEQVMASQDWKTILAMKGSSRGRKLGRLMNRALKGERDRSNVPRPI